MSEELRRLYSRITRNTFFHVEDRLDMVKREKDGAITPNPKLRLFAGNYQSGGVEGFVVHYIDLATARVVFRDISQVHRQDVSWTDFKGGDVEGRGVLSNVLKINTSEYKSEKRLFLEFTLAPGEREASGIVKPKGKNVIANVNIMLSVWDAREMAETVLAYLAAFDVLRLMQHTKGENFPPFVLSVRRDDGQAGATSQSSRPQDRYTYGDGTKAPNHPRTRFALDQFWTVHNRSPRDGSEIEVWWQENRHLYSEEETG